MTFVLAVLLLSSLTAFAAPAPLHDLPRLKAGGREYVRLADWAKRNGLKTALVSRQQLKVFNNIASITFTVDSPRITVNGTSVWLSAPVAAWNGAACVTPVDLAETLQPLLWPTRHRAIKRLKVVCVDAGHGGKDAGNCEGTKLEKDYALLLARDVEAQLRRAGYLVTLTRTSDTFIDLDNRPEIARRRQADLFLSLHFNAAASREVRGVETYCLTPAKTASTNARGEDADTGSLPGNQQNGHNILLAYQLQRAITGGVGLTDRGVRRARWAVLRTADMPAALIEAGYMSNAAELKQIESAVWRRQLAQAIVEGVKNYFRLVDPPKQ